MSGSSTRSVGDRDPLISREESVREGGKTSLLSRITSSCRAVFSETRPLYEGSLQPTLLAQDIATGTPAIGAVEQAVNPTHVVTRADQGISAGLDMTNGITTIAIGILHGAKGKVMTEKASTTKDQIGAQIGLSRMVRIPGDVTRGSASLIKGGATIAATAKATQVINVASKVVAGGSFITALSLMAMCGSFLHEARKIEQELHTKGTPRDKVQYLQSLRELSAEEKTKVVENLLLGKESGNVATRFAHKLFGVKEDDKTKALKAFLNNPSDEAAKTEVEKLFGQGLYLEDEPLLKPIFQDGECITPLVEKYLQDKNFTPAVKNRIAIALQKLCQTAIDNEAQRKKDVFGRAIDSEAVKLLDACSDIKNISQLDAIAIVKAAEKGFIYTKGLMTLGVTLSILWIGVTIAAFILTGGISAIVEAVIGLVISLAAVGLDGYYLYQEFKEKKALMAKDKVFMFAMSLITAIAGGLAVAAAKSVANRVTAGVISLVWLALLLYSVWGRRSTEEPAPAVVPQNDNPDSGFGSAVG